MSSRHRVIAGALVLIVGLAAWVTFSVLRGHADTEAPGKAPQTTTNSADRIAALGRLEPKDGVIRVAGPSQPAVVISRLLVDDGDKVKAGQVLAVLDSFTVLEATTARLEAELKNALAELRRHQELYRQGIVSDSQRDSWQTKVDVLRADLQRAKAELELAEVCSPIDGQVIEVHTRAGERVGPEGILELGRTDEMYAVAEVYETDIGRVRLGQRATITSPALEEEVYGTVDRIGLKIGKKDVLDTDPAARTDARVVEVEIRLDDAETVAGLTNLQVDVVIMP